VSELFEHFLRVGDELDVNTRRSFVSGETAGMIGEPLAHEAFEWMALLDSIAEARGRLTMLELGAGFGRWTVRAVAAMRMYRPDLTYHVVAVEAEPTHFEWLKLHMDDNEVATASSNGRCKLVNSAVGASDGRSDFYVGNPAGWYGQALVRPENAGAAAPVQRVRTIMLSDLIDPLERVDLIDVDIQGAELDVLREAAPLLNRVRRVYVETHSEAIDKGLPAVFEDAAGDWSPVVAAPLGAHQTTPLGEASFDEGGVQLWLNRGALPESA
jgi:FkbM family methyltransferase